MKCDVVVFDLLGFVTCHLSLNVNYINLNGPKKLTVTFCMLNCASICGKLVSFYCLILFSAVLLLIKYTMTIN